ncbi:MoaD/ThiS family protein [Galbitalea sp. SE-J8]|uniref:MoaD/ThiS family protein n=1 Tax=Galbitalea sp. SE-J8 TaxID=3054952 RepID=UPI00259D1595|nr:MoaD/ThiS family protein [Galbitalea sp. SE-J8]MDM4764283.1 MoaD/ThiS family protein [Galbitalea sp. SE-J8]
MASPSVVTVRYFAGAAEAAGTREETLSAVATVGELKAAIIAAHGARMERVLASGSFLVDGVVSRDDARPLGPSTGSGAGGTGSGTGRVDVLPPFAGG